MCKKVLFLLLSVCLLSVAAFGLNRNWDGDTNDDWDDPCNWVENAVPDACDLATLFADTMSETDDMPIIYAGQQQMSHRCSLAKLQTVSTLYRL